MHRAASPALSETEVDISRALFSENLSEDEQIGATQTVSKAGAVAQQADPFADDDDDDAFIAASQAAANRRNDSKAAKKVGAFQHMGLNANLLKAITRKGYSVPTPIQRKTIPIILQGQDVVGMARTGSGKTAAFVIPMVDKLKMHSAKVGARAIILSPSRELALQTLKVVKEMSRGTDLRTILLIGGDSLEEQFSSMASNPDIVVATPGRFEHLKVEMGLNLSSVQYIVFDEADRLFEMGFAAQLAEIMHSLPAERQTLLFSATLPKSLVEFARAGLHEPKLIRLDADAKMAPTLQSAFFLVKRAEKEAALLHLLEDVIKMPTGDTKAKTDTSIASKKRKRGAEVPSYNELPSPYSTVIFAATKHHVEYLAAFLKACGYPVSYVYGSLDQVARKTQTQEFRNGETHILVVTDVAARGLDVPLLANVINYDFPSQPKIYVHRVGRTARAGRDGWSYSLITPHDMPYLLDLQLFLGRKLTMGRANKSQDLFKSDVVAGTFHQDDLEQSVEEVNKIIKEDTDLAAMQVVASKGEKQYLRTRNSASAESVKRARQLLLSPSTKEINALFTDQDVDLEQARQDMLARVSGFRPQETVFEVGKRGQVDATVEIVKRQRAKTQSLRASKASQAEPSEDSVQARIQDRDQDSDSEDELILTRPDEDMEEVSDEELNEVFAKTPRSRAHGFQDGEHFMSYAPAHANVAEDRGYGVHSGGNTNFLTEAHSVSMDLANDESKGSGLASRPGMRWDKKGKKYVSRANDEDGSKGKRFITGESGQKIAASFRSGRFDAWRKANKVSRLPRVGELERDSSNAISNGMTGGKRFKHKQDKAPKEADRYRDDYEIRKKRVAEAKEARRGRFADGDGKNELRGAEDIRKQRRLKEKRKEKNARPSKRR